MSLSNRARKLASLTAAGAGAIALTSGAAKASVMTATPNFTLSFSKNANPSSFHVPASHLFSISADAPRFSAVLYSLVAGAGTFNRFVNFYGGGRSIEFVNAAHARVAAGKTWDQVFVNSATYGRIADRLWGNASTIHGLPGGNGFYELFRFVSGGNTDYGWIEYNIAMTKANSSLAVDGPNVTVVAYAWDTDPSVHLAAGQTSTAPEPATPAETALGALVLGAEGLRRLAEGQKDNLGCQLARDSKTPDVQVLSVDYAAALLDPRGTAQRLAQFLGAPFDVGAAAQSVDPSLRRQQVSP